MRIINPNTLPGIPCDATVNQGTWDERKCNNWACVEYIGLHFCSRHAEKLEHEVKEKMDSDRRERNLRHEENKQVSHTVYYLRRKDGLVKIGYTNNLVRRRTALEKQYGPLKLMCAHYGYRNVEGKIHQMFEEYRVEGEWFEMGNRLKKHIYKVATGYLPTFGTYDEVVSKILGEQLRCTAYVENKTENILTNHL